MTDRAKQQQGIVLPLVLIIALLLSASILTFVRRSVMDGMVVRNRNDSSAAAALARGGVQIGMAVVFDDRMRKELEAAEGGVDPGNTFDDAWSKTRLAPLESPSGRLTIRIEDSGSRFNLNSLVPAGVEGAEAKPEDEAEEFLVEFINKILDEMKLKMEQRLYDPREMARNLLDYIDADEVAIGGRSEDDYYLAQNPPSVARNRPLLSVDEIAMIEGFDTQMMEAMRPYVTVYPLVSDEGINLNTAPAYVLSLIYHGSSGDMQLADQDIVREILKARRDGSIVCDKSETAPDRCVTRSSVGLGTGAIYPPASLPSVGQVFTIKAEASVGEITRTIEAVIDLSDLEQPQVLSWKTL